MSYSLYIKLKYTHIYMYTYIHIYTYNTHIYTHTYIHTYIHIYIHTYIYIYIHTHYNCFEIAWNHTYPHAHVSDAHTQTSRFVEWMACYQPLPVHLWCRRGKFPTRGTLLLILYCSKSNPQYPQYCFFFSNIVECYPIIYPLVISHSHGKSPFLIGKPSINGPLRAIFHGYVK